MCDARGEDGGGGGGGGVCCTPDGPGPSALGGAEPEIAGGRETSPVGGIVARLGDGG